MVNNFLVRLVETEQDLLASQRLRYQVFVEELGASGKGVDHDRRLETDKFDEYFDHLILVNRSKDPKNLDHVLGVYRLLRDDIAKSTKCGFYSRSEFDLSKLTESGRSLVELGRSCTHPDIRGSTAMFSMWNGLADYVIDHNIEIMFGVASFHGTDAKALSNPISHLHCSHLAPEPIRVTALPQSTDPVMRLPCDQVNVGEALKAIPPLIKSYLRLGGVVGDGTFFDFEFNTTDVCLIVDTENMSESHRVRYRKYRGTK